MTGNATAAAAMPRITGDRRLVRIARTFHPGCVWWWGRRTIDGHGAAVCYVCDDVMAAWGGRVPIPDALRRAIIYHRATHLDNGARRVHQRTGER